MRRVGSVGACPHEQVGCRRGTDLAARLAEAKAALPGVRSAEDFGRVLRRFTAALQDGHAWSTVPGARRHGSRPLPFRLAACAEGIAVVAVASGSTARASAIC